MKKNNGVVSSQRFNSLSFLCSAILMLMIFLGCGRAFAQDDAPTPAENTQRQSAKNLNEYFRGKYKFERSGSVQSSIRQTEFGPRGNLHLFDVEIGFDNITDLPGEDGHARALAKAFMEEEADVLGITDMNEIRESRFSKNDGFVKDIVVINYARYIGELELEGSYFEVRLWQNKIRSLSTALVPVSPELYAAAREKRMSKDKAVKIVERDIKAAGHDPKGMKLWSIKEIAIPDAPYVIWHVNCGVERGGRWLYRINAFTGEIIKKSNLVWRD